MCSVSESSVFLNTSTHASRSFDFMLCVIFAHSSSAKSEKPVVQFCCSVELVVPEYTVLTADEVLCWRSGVGGDCAVFAEPSLEFGADVRASKSDTIMGRPTKSLTRRVCAAAMALVVFDGGIARH